MINTSHGKSVGKYHMVIRVEIYPWMLALQSGSNCCVYRMSKISRSATENSRPKACYFPIVQKYKKANLIRIYPWYAAIAKQALRPQYGDHMNLSFLRKLE